VVCFVWLSDTFVHCAQTVEDSDTISFAYDSPMSLSNCVKIRFTPVNRFLPKFCPTVTCPLVDLSVGDIPWQLAAEWLEIAQWSQQRTYRKPLFLFEWYEWCHRWPLISLSPKWGSKMCPEEWRQTSRRVLPRGEYDRRYRQEPRSNVAFCHITLAPVRYFIGNSLEF